MRSTTVVICRPRMMNTFGFGFSSLISWHSAARCKYYQNLLTLPCTAMPMTTMHYVYSKEPRYTWSTNAFRSTTLLINSIYIPPAGVNCCNTVILTKYIQSLVFFQRSGTQCWTVSVMLLNSDSCRQRLKNCRWIQVVLTQYKFALYTFTMDADNYIPPRPCLVHQPLWYVWLLATST